MEKQVRIVRAEEQEVLVAWREHKAVLAEERRGRRSQLLSGPNSRSSNTEEHRSIFVIWCPKSSFCSPLFRSAVVTCFLESLLFTALVIPLPLALIATELLFHYGTRLIPPDRLEQLW